LRRADGHLLATCIPAIAGFLEVRGMGAIAVAARATAVLGLVVDLVAPDEIEGWEIERWPEPTLVALLGVAVPSLKLAPFESSACAKLRLAAREAKAGRLGVIAPQLSRAAPGHSQVGPPSQETQARPSGVTPWARRAAR
jgi:serine kinase of HPr protein (carbohydrate metabolism regulator)